MSVLNHLWLLALFSLCCAVVSHAQCPASGDVFPCVCTSDQYYNLDMDCSQVESEDQLRQVFSAYLPSPEFRELKIENNQHLGVLREGDLGSASFQVITITGGVLTEVEAGALTQSVSTLTEIDMTYNQLTKFPFEELPLWTSFTNLYLGHNAFPIFPVLVSDSLLNVGMSYNMISDIPADAFKAAPKVQYITAYGNTLREITPGLFSGLDGLIYVSLGSNQLTQISNGDLSMKGSGKGLIYLEFNNIWNIAVGGISGLNDGYLSLLRNALRVIPEDVFRPILEGGASIFLAENPLDCGCDIAWLIKDASFMSQIDSNPPASCDDGELLSDLDPSIYEDLC